MEKTPDGFGLKANSVGTFGLLAQSVGAASPEIAASVTTILAVDMAGAGAPSSFLLGGVGVFCLGAVLAYLSRRITTAGGLAGLVEATLGEEAALVTGWASLIGIGLIIGVVALLGGVFVALFFGQVVGPHYWAANNWAIWSAIIWVSVVALAIAGVRPSVAVLFAISVVGIGCLTIFSLVILGHNGSAMVMGAHGLALSPAHGLPWSSLVPGGVKGVSWDQTFRAIAFVIIGFQGFESATNLGEEASAPSRQIPVVLIAVVGIVWVFVTLVCMALVTGFGTQAAGINILKLLQALAWINLSQAFMTAWFGDMVIGLLAVSCFAAGIGLINEMSRILWSLSRQGLLPKPLSRTNNKTGSPWVAVAALAGLALVELIGSYWWQGSNPIAVTNAATWIASVAAPGLLIAYILAAVGGAWLAHKLKAPFTVRVLCPVVVVLVFGMSLYHQFIPLPQPPLGQPPGPYHAAPFVGLGLLIAGAAAIAVYATLRQRGSASRAPA